MAIGCRSSGEVTQPGFKPLTVDSRLTIIALANKTESGLGRYPRFVKLVPPATADPSVSIVLRFDRTFRSTSQKKAGKRES